MAKKNGWVEIPRAQGGSILVRKAKGYFQGFFPNGRYFRFPVRAFRNLLSRLDSPCLACAYGKLETMAVKNSKIALVCGACDALHTLKGDRVRLIDSETRLH